MYLAQLALMGISSLQDIREHKVYLVLPLAMILSAVGSRLILHPVDEWLSMLILCGVVIGTGFCVQRFLGMGDTLVYASVSILIGWHGSVFVLSTTSMLLVPYMIVCCVGKKQEKLREIPLIPFLTGGYLIWLILH